jgi:hypothetical protein
MASITTGWRNVLARDVGEAPGIVGAKPYPNNVFYVDSVTANTNASVDGKSWANAYSTIAYAISQCTASRGDVIYVSPRHAETISAAAGIDVSVAGVSIIGLGNGSNRGTISIGTLTTATFKISAANVRVSNLRFDAVTAQLLVKMIDVGAGNATIDNCWFRAASTATFLVKSFINIATTFDDITIYGCEFYQGTDPNSSDGAADTGAIFMVDSENVTIQGCKFFGNFETALIHNRTTKVQNLWVIDCVGYCALSGSEPFQLVAAASGGCVGGMFITPAETGATEATLVGTIGDVFFISPTTGFGNDGLAGGQGGIIVATAS